LLPAVQAAREAARRVQCQNNVKQLAMACHDYHDAHSVLPPLYTDEKNPKFTLAFGLQTHAWRSLILPHIEQQQLAEEIRFDLLATDAANQGAVTQIVAAFHCPSTPRSAPIARGLWHGRSQFDESRRAATTDYNGSAGYVEAGVVSRQLICAPGVTQYFWNESWTPGVWGEVVYGQAVWDPPTVRKVNFKAIADGLSQSVLILERAGLPDQYFDGGASFEPHQPPQYRTWANVGLWAISGYEQFNQIHHRTGAPLVNDDNMVGMYSFHPGGAQTAFVDGSVRFLHESVDAETVLALVSREAGDLVDLSNR
jgi:prepilin-type processing-associated H-X9-DG protein